MKYLSLLTMVIFISSCHKTRDIQFKESLTFLGGSTDNIESLLQGADYVFVSDDPKNSHVFKSYTWNKKKYDTSFVIFNQCSPNKIICSVIYSISENDYKNKIPAELKQMNFKAGEIEEFNGTTENEKITNCDYALELDRERKLYTLVSLRKKTWNKSYYTIEISSVDLNEKKENE